MFVLKTMTFHLLDGISQMSLNCVKWVSLLPDLELRLTSRIQVRTVSEEVSQQKALAARGPQLRHHTPAASRLPQHCPWVTLTDSLQARDSGWLRLIPALPPACLRFPSACKGDIGTQTHTAPQHEGTGQQLGLQQLLHLSHSECSV